MPVRRSPKVGESYVGVSFKTCGFVKKSNEPSRQNRMSGSDSKTQWSGAQRSGKMSQTFYWSPITWYGRGAALRSFPSFSNLGTQTRGLMLYCGRQHIGPNYSKLYHSCFWFGAKWNSSTSLSLWNALGPTPGVSPLWFKRTVKFHGYQPQIGK